MWTNAHSDSCEWTLIPRELGRKGLGDGGEGGYADETLLKREAGLQSPDATCLFVCERETGARSDESNTYGRRM